MDDHYKSKLFSIILPKTSTYIKRYDSETKWIFFFLKDVKYDEQLKMVMRLQIFMIKKKPKVDPIFVSQ